MSVPGTIKMSDLQGPQAPDGAGQSVNRILAVSYRGREEQYGLVKLERTFVTIGRAPDNDIRVESPVVSLYHATLQLRRDGCYIIDGQDRAQPGKFDPSTNGLYTSDGQPVRGEHRLQSGESIGIQSSTAQYNVTFTYYSKTETLLLPFPLGNKPQIRIGRLPTSDLVLPHLTVSGLHAELLRQANGSYVLVHKSHTNGTYVNNQLVNDRITLKPQDQIRIGPFTYVYDGNYLNPTGKPRDIRGKGPRVDAIHVSKVVITHPSLKKTLATSKNIGEFFTGIGKSLFGADKTLLRDVTLPIQPGDFVAVVGGSGTGKSTLLKSMIGILDTEKGSEVLINGEDLFINFNRYRGEIGYVPQDDIIHNDLTPEQVMYYVVRLRNESVKPAERAKFIADKLEQVQLTDQKGTVVSQLSGGQRKRLSIAVELAAEPSILVLDEPTSGLDPGLDQVMMKLLAKLASEGKTVILVTHATENVGLCSKVAFMAEGGVLTFYGKPDEAKTFFGVEQFSSIYLLLNTRDKGNLILQDKDKDWAKTYVASPYYKQYVEVPEQALQSLRATAVPPPFKVRKSALSVFFSQSLILAMRYLQANLFTFFIMLLLPVVLSLLFFLVARQDLFTVLKPTLRDLANLMVDQKAQIKFNSDVFSIQQVIFMLATVSVLVGLFGSFQEIVKERGIYDRERLVNLNIAAYVFSKFIVLAVLAFIQATLLVFVLDYWVTVSGDGLTGLGPKWEMVVSIFLVILASVSFGLLVSALVNRKREQTTIALILLVTIQILFSGVIFILKGSSEWLTYLTLTRWGSEAVGSSIGLHTVSGINPWIKAVVENLQMTFGDKDFMYGRWAVLVAYIIGLVLLTGFTLYWQDTVRKRQMQKRK